MENYAGQPRPLTVTLDNSAPYVATRLHAKESLSDGTWLEVHLLSPSPPDEGLPGKMAVVTCRERTFAGLIQQIECDGFHPDKQLYFYRIIAVDPLTFLSHGRQRRLFQNQNSKGQISTLLNLHQLTAFVRFSLSGEGETRPCMCQMDESDSAMIRRIMAGQGWFCLHNPAISRSGQSRTDYSMCRQPGRFPPVLSHRSATAAGSAAGYSPQKAGRRSSITAALTGRHSPAAVPRNRHTIMTASLLRHVLPVKLPPRLRIIMRPGQR